MLQKTDLCLLSSLCKHLHRFGFCRGIADDRGTENFRQTLSRHLTFCALRHSEHTRTDDFSLLAVTSGATWDELDPTEDKPSGISGSFFNRLEALPIALTISVSPIKGMQIVNCRPIFVIHWSMFHCKWTFYKL